MGATPPSPTPRPPPPLNILISDWTFVWSHENSPEIVINVPTTLAMLHTFLKVHTLNLKLLKENLF